LKKLKEKGEKIKNKVDLFKYLTIIIPCKNEKKIIQKTLDLLNYQSGIEGVQVIVCDASDDVVTNKGLVDRLKYNFDKFNLYLSTGGLPAKARNTGFNFMKSSDNKLIKTPYVLFIDSDIFFLDPKVIINSFVKIYINNLDLVTVKFRSDSGKYNYVYKTFDILQSISKLSTPFCLGGFMMVRTEIFEDIGGFDEEIKVAEDYMFSKQIKPNKFGRVNKIVFTSPRRFENKGLIYMINLFIGSFFNHKRKSYFTEDKSYWE
jgi:glycosyltransferase involved in cell wall biosynthesis